jgi:hypothetical protein
LEINIVKAFGGNARFFTISIYIFFLFIHFPKNIKFKIMACGGAYFKVIEPSS